MEWMASRTCCSAYLLAAAIMLAGCHKVPRSSQISGLYHLQGSNLIGTLRLEEGGDWHYELFDRNNLKLKKSGKWAREVEADGDYTIAVGLSSFTLGINTFEEEIIDERSIDRPGLFLLNLELGYNGIIRGCIQKSVSLCFVKEFR